MTGSAEPYYGEALYHRRAICHDFEMSPVDLYPYANMYIWTVRSRRYEGLIINRSGEYVARIARESETTSDTGIVASRQFVDRRLRRCCSMQRSLSRERQYKIQLRQNQSRAILPTQFASFIKICQGKLHLLLLQA